MRVVEVVGPASVRVHDRVRPSPGLGELLVAPLAVGVCATDLELLDGSMVYLRQGLASYPLVPGHEWVGTVVEVGADAEGFEVGDRVVGECSVGCRRCPVCAAGAYHQCPDRQETGILRLDGALTDAMRFPATSAHRISGEVDALDAVLTEPLAVAYRAATRLLAPCGAPLLVVGAGTIGLLVALVARDHLELSVRIAEVREDRRARALSLGFGVVERADDGRYPFVVEATGSPSGVRAAQGSLASGGHAVLLGLTGSSGVDLDVDALVVNDQTLTGSLGSPHVWPEVIALLEGGVVRPSVLVTHQFDLNEFPAAVELLRRDENGVGKVVVTTGLSL